MNEFEQVNTEEASRSNKNAKKLLNFQSNTMDNCLVEEAEPDGEPVQEEASKKPVQPPKPNGANLITNTPAVDFKLDVKIEINSGKCILHAAKPGAYNTSKSDHQAKSDRLSYSSYLNMNMNDSTKTSKTSSSGKNLINDSSEFRNTNFIFPAIKVKAFYESLHKKIENRLSKKANLYAMIKLESFVMPSFTHNLLSNKSRDMCLSPALLDFLEQSLEPFDALKASMNSMETASNTPVNPLLSKNFPPSASLAQTEFGKEIVLKKNLTNSEAKASEKSKEGVKPHENAAYFPVEVVVFVSMLPSSIRFTCLPQSTMECLLKLPTLEMVFSTYKIDSQAQEKLLSRLNEQENVLLRPSFTEELTQVRTVEEGGLSVTCSMTDFSLKFYNRLALQNTNDARFFYSDQSSKLIYKY